MSTDFLSFPPMTTRSALNVSWNAEPWRRNSGFIHKPKSVPHFFFDSISRMGLTVFCVVPGTTVLLTTTTLYWLFLLSAFPMSCDTVSMHWRSILPSGLLGVPTATYVMSVSRTAFCVWFVRQCR